MGVVRMQILLHKEQAEQLRALARKRRVSISALVREMVERGLQEEQERLLTEQARALEEIRAAHQSLRDVGAEPVTAEDIAAVIRQMREERTDEILSHILGRD